MLKDDFEEAGATSADLKRGELNFLFHGA